MEQLARNLVSWIREQVLAAGCQGAVVGMSGGLDSAVVAVLCKHAFPEHVLGVLMPCQSDSLDQEHALAVARKFAIPTQTIVLDGVFEALLQALPQVEAEAARLRLARSNLKPRLRMAVLYYLANSLHHLVVGSGNRSERAIGYFTKYGDGGVDILPLGNLVKRLVRELAAHLGIPQEIIDKPPSAGLWPGQTDEEEIGLSYEKLDGYLTTGQAGKEVRRKIEAMMTASQHKHSLPSIPPS